jgi:hypothetical protein
MSAAAEGVLRSLLANFFIFRGTSSNALSRHLCAGHCLDHTGTGGRKKGSVDKLKREAEIAILTPTSGGLETLEPEGEPITIRPILGPVRQVDGAAVQLLQGFEH